MMLQSNATDDEILKKTQITEQQLQDIKDVVAREHKTNIDKIKHLITVSFYEIMNYKRTL